MVEGGIFYINCRDLSEFDAFMLRTIQAMRSDPSGSFRFTKDQSGNNLQDVKFNDVDYMRNYFNTVLLDLVTKADLDFIFFSDNVDGLIKNS